MIVSISEDIRIHGTETCYALERKHKRKGVDDWKPFKYYTTFADAVGEACEREIRTHPAHDLVEAIEAAHAVANKYADLLDDVVEQIAERARRATELRFVA